MMRTTIFPRGQFYSKPSFWGIERDLKDVMDTIEHTWEGTRNSTINNYKETDQGYFFSIEIPGVSKTSLEISIEGEQITIEGIKRNVFLDDESEGEKISRKILIPKKVARAKIQAHHEDGILYFALPKQDEEKPFKIKINDGASESFDKLLKDS